MNVTGSGCPAHVISSANASSDHGFSQDTSESTNHQKKRTLGSKESSSGLLLQLETTGVGGINV